MDKEKTTANASKESGALRHRIFTVIGIVMCVILVPILIVNVTLIIKGYTNTEEVPSIGGKTILIVLTDSMYPEIKGGDLIICQKTPAEDVEVGDVISFFDPDGSGKNVVTHKVVEILTDGGLQFRTRGVNNNADDKTPVPAKNLVGVYETRIPYAGNVAMFMQTTAGLIVCVVLPLILLIGYDIIRRKQYEKLAKQDTAALLAELEALKAEKAKNAQSTTSQQDNNGQSQDDLPNS